MATISAPALGTTTHSSGEGYSPKVNGLAKPGPETDQKGLTQLSPSLAAMLSRPSRQTDQANCQLQTPEAIQEAIGMSHALQSSESETIGPSELDTNCQPVHRARLPIRSIIKPAARKAVCTHTTLDRVWGSQFTCSHCRKVSPLGWSYQCAQDHGEDALPCLTLESLDIRNPQEIEGYFQRLEHKSMQLGQLSPWILKAIRENHYTEGQIAILEAQKQGVNDNVFAAAEAAYQEGDSTRFFPSRSSPPQRSLSGLLGIEAPSPPPPSYGEYMLRLVPNRSQRCTYRTCQNCRPVSRDRAWACIDHAMALAIVPDLNFEYDFRPVSNVDLVRNIGLRTPPKPPKTKYERPLPPLPFPSSQDVVDVRDGRRDPHSSNQENGADRQSAKSGTTKSQASNDGSSIPKSLRRTLKGFWDGRRSWIPSRTPSLAESKVSLCDNRIENRGLPTESIRDKPNGDLEHLHRAIQVPLPNEDDKDALGNDSAEDRLNDEGEVIVDDGVAVTEEAIFFHEADIITSV